MEAASIVPFFSAAEELLVVKFSKFFPDDNDPSKVDVTQMAAATKITESSIRFALKLPLPEDEERIARLMAQCDTRAALRDVALTIQERSILELQAIRQQVRLSNHPQRIALARTLPEDHTLLSEVYEALLAGSRKPGEVLKIYKMIPETRATDEDKAIVRLAGFFLKPKTGETKANP